MKKYYNKLVRDNIPEIIRDRGSIPYTRILSTEEYKIELKNKLLEEYEEVVEATSKENLIEECADVIEVALAIAQSEQVSQQELFDIMVEKRNKRGGFQNKILLEKVLEQESPSL